MRKLAFVTARAVLLCAAPVRAQSPLAFEVAAIKPGVKDVGSGPSRLDGGRYMAANYTLIQLLEIAHGVKPPYQISGGPAWTNQRSTRSPPRCQAMAPQPG